MQRDPVIDADGHIIESDADIFEYLPPPYRGETQLFAYPFFPTLDGWHRSARRVTDKAGIRTERPNAMLAVDVAPNHNLGLDRLQRLIEVRTLTHPFSQMIQLTSMMFSGVFDAFPGLRVAYCEAGSGWVPFMADRLDMEFANRR